MGTTQNHVSVQVYVHSDNTVTINVVSTQYPSQGHWKNTFSTILRGERLHPLDAELRASRAVAEAIHQALDEAATRERP